MPTEVHELTFGEKAVGLTFNPSNDLKVQELKEAFAKVIDIVNNMRAPESGNGEVRRLVEIAITEAQTAQMWAVKAATWKE